MAQDFMSYKNTLNGVNCRAESLNLVTQLKFRAQYAKRPIKDANSCLIACSKVSLN